MGNGKEVILEVKNMSKHFALTVALNHVDMQFYRGEICGLIGENGSGKSTLSSIVAGMQPPTEGEMLYKGQPYKPANTLDAQNQGVGMVVQEAGTIEGISVAENIYLGKENAFKLAGFINTAKMNKSAQKVLDAIGVSHIQAPLPTGMYDMQDRKLIEVAKTVDLQPEVFIVDETTTSLSQTGRETLYKLMRQFAADGKCVIFISHDLDELIEICDSLNVLRDGDYVGRLERAEFDEDKIKQLMVGRQLEGNYYRVDCDPYDDEVVLKAEKITTAQDLMNFSLTLHKGEILGIGGLSHCGMHTLGRALFGLEKLFTGKVEAKGQSIDSPDTAMKGGLGYVSKNRDTESLVLGASIQDNIASAGFDKYRSAIPGLVSMGKRKKYVNKQIEDLSIKCASPDQFVQFLSGGNKQKVVFGKWVGRDSDILILDCPTRGVDIGVKAAMYNLMYEMKKAGKAIVMISEELPELIGMSDRLLILKDGRVSGEFMRADGVTEGDVINYMI